MFQVNRKALESELALLQTVAEKKSTMPILSTVLFDFDGELLTLTASDIDSTIITKISASGEAWSGCIPMRQLGDLSRLLYGDVLTFLPENERVTIKLDKSRHKLPAFGADKFPEITQPEMNMTTMDGAVLSKALQRALRCVSTDAKESWMQGVSFRSWDDKVFVTATNSRHLATTEIEAALEIDAVIPIKAATALVKFLDGEVEIGASENQIIFRQGTRVFTARLLDVKFPDWRPLVPGLFKHSIVLDPESARLAFKLAAVTASETALIPIPLRLTISKGELAIETAETDRGHSAESLPIECPTLNGDSVSRSVNGSHFIGFLDADLKTIMSFNDDLRIIRLSPETEPNYRYITMALKV